MGGNKRALASLDWLLALNDDSISLVQCKGLRNAPSQQYECITVRKIALPQDLLETASLSRLLTSAMLNPGEFDDKFNLTVLNNTATNLFKLSVDLNSAPTGMRLGQNAPAMPTAALHAAIRLNPTAPLKISKMLAHPSLPLVALVYSGDSTLIEVYKMSEHMLPTVNEPDFSLHGTYASPGSEVIDAQWAGDLD